jgi:hypothetical protein
MQEYQVTNKSTNWVQDESLKSEGRQHVGHQRAHRPCRWPVHLPQGRHVVSTQTCPPWGLSFSCSVDLEVRPPWLPNKQSRRNRAGDRQQPLPSVPIKQGDLGDERRKLSMPAQFRITTDANKYMFLQLSAVLVISCFRPVQWHSMRWSRLVVLCTRQPPSNHTCCVLKRRNRNGAGGQMQEDMQGKLVPGSLVGNSSRKWQRFWGVQR